jgi:ATP-dependent Clp endopeptidase proteolytic subunit ClpP
MRLSLFNSAPPTTAPPVTPPTTQPNPTPSAAPPAVLTVPAADTVQIRRQLDNAPFVLTIQGQINDSTSQQLLNQLEQFERWYRKPDGSFDHNRVKAKPIQVKIDSGGGAVHSALGLIDKLELFKKAGIIVETSVYGLSASMAALISSSGSKGHRYAARNSTIMIHQPLMTSTGPTRQYISEMGKDAAHAKRISNILRDILKANMNGKMSEAELKEAMQENHYMGPEEAKSVGLIDHIGFPVVKGFDEAPANNHKKPNENGAIAANKN